MKQPSLNLVRLFSWKVTNLIFPMVLVLPLSLTDQSFFFLPKPLIVFHHLLLLFIQELTHFSPFHLPQFLGFFPATGPKEILLLRKEGKEWKMRGLFPEIALPDLCLVTSPTNYLRDWDTSEPEVKAMRYDFDMNFREGSAERSFRLPYLGCKNVDDHYMVDTDFSVSFCCYLVVINIFAAHTERSLTISHCRGLDPQRDEGQLTVLDSHC